MRYAVAAAVAVAAALLAGAGMSVPADDRDGPEMRPGFATDARFADGRAEVHTYEAVVVREGAPRSTRAYTVLVAEDLDPETRVKADDWTRSGLVRAFKYGLYFKAQTGMSEFREAVNAFLSADGWRLVKLLYSTQDWCGVTLETIVPDGAQARLSWTSYWEEDGGSGSRALPGGGRAIPVDAFPAWIRAVRLAPGAEFEISVLPTLQGSRVGRPQVHRAIVTVEAVLEAEVPAGTFRAFPVRLVTGDSESRYLVEEAFPHRIVAWTDSLGQTFRLVKSQRSAYWQRVADGDEELLEP
jgi:hypothetical protein